MGDARPSRQGWGIREEREPGYSNNETETQCVLHRGRRVLDRAKCLIDLGERTLNWMSARVSGRR